MVLLFAEQNILDISGLQHNAVRWVLIWKQGTESQGNGNHKGWRESGEKEGEKQDRGKREAFVGFAVVNPFVLKIEIEYALYYSL